MPMVIGQRVGEVTRVRIDRPLRPPTALDSTVATEAADRICALPNHRETYFHCVEISYIVGAKPCKENASCT